MLHLTRISNNKTKTLENLALICGTLAFNSTTNYLQTQALNFITRIRIESFYNCPRVSSIEDVQRIETENHFYKKKTFTNLFKKKSSLYNHTI